MYWLITNRNVMQNGFGTEFAEVTYWTAPLSADPLAKASWTQVTRDAFHAALKRAADQYPHPLQVSPEDQKHVTLLVHGYNNAWSDAMALYQRVVLHLYGDASGLGECIAFDWPSKGSLLGYLPDRAEARRSAQDLANVLGDLYDWLLVKQTAAKANLADACKAKTSVIAHSMGNYVLECGMNYAWTQKNRPLLVSLLHEAVMVAADVDNDLFRAGDTVTHGDGEGISNLTYRVSALCSGRDGVLGASAGLKHFGKRRLGRSGLDRTVPVPDNVWDIDCSDLIHDNVNGIATHSAYFNPNESACLPLIRQILRGIDRSVLIARGHVPNALVRVQPRA